MRSRCPPSRRGARTKAAAPAALIGTVDAGGREGGRRAQQAAREQAGGGDRCGSGRRPVPGRQARFKMEPPSPTDDDGAAPASATFAPAVAPEGASFSIDSEDDAGEQSAERERASPTPPRSAPRTTEDDGGGEAVGGRSRAQGEPDAAVQDDDDDDAAAPAHRLESLSLVGGEACVCSGAREDGWLAALRPAPPPNRPQPSACCGGLLQRRRRRRARRGQERRAMPRPTQRRRTSRRST
eukprot:scaffold2644_cov339-Prasinococcus_capsulatus_cf.AAC.1